MISVGQTVGNYRISAKLGEGGMGAVFLAEHPVIDSKVALKAVHPRFAQDAEVLYRFVNEAKAVNQIRHDHIVDITDFGHTEGGDFYFIMEYLQGETLAAAITREGRFAEARALNIACQLADALQASHEKGIIHRDLKPENIFLISRDGTDDFVKVLDFGLAKLTVGQPATSKTSRVGVVAGTPYYMSPEQCEGRQDIDCRADVYSLGVVLFEMLTGFVPFGGSGFGEIIMKHMIVPPPSARSIVADLPRALDAVLFRALSKEPGRRYQTMTQFRAAMRDPAGHASPRTSAGFDQNISARIQAAVPRSRTGLPLNAERSARASSPGAAKAETQNEDHPRPPRSTFRSTVGELNQLALPPVPRNSGGRTASLVAIAVLCGLGVGGVGLLRSGSLRAGVAVAARPATVRVNVNSDPDGATVNGPDGAVLGSTPLSMLIPYGEARVQFVVRKDGFRSKTTSLVPNLPSALFIPLAKAEPAPIARVTAVAPRAVSAAVSSRHVRQRLAAAPSAPVAPEETAPIIDDDDDGDGDGVLELGVY